MMVVLYYLFLYVIIDYDALFLPHFVNKYLSLKLLLITWWSFCIVSFLSVTCHAHYPYIHLVLIISLYVCVCVLMCVCVRSFHLFLCKSHIYTRINKLGSSKCVYNSGMYTCRNHTMSNKKYQAFYSLFLYGKLGE